MPLAAPIQTMTIGEIRVTYLPDGETRLIPTAFFPASTDDGWKLHPEWLDEEGRLLASIGGFLIEAGTARSCSTPGSGPGTRSSPALARSTVAGCSRA
jgi:hypothetical protein